MRKRYWPLHIRFANSVGGPTRPRHEVSGRSRRSSRNREGRDVPPIRNANGSGRSAHQSPRLLPLRGRPGTTIMVMTVNSGAGLSAPDARIEFAQRVAKVVRNIATQEELVADPAGRANHVVGRLFPTVLSFELGSRTGRTVSGFNGRALDDDVMGMIPALPTAHCSAPTPRHLRNGCVGLPVFRSALQRVGTGGRRFGETNAAAGIGARFPMASRCASGCTGRRRSSEALW